MNSSFKYTLPLAAAIILAGCGGSSSSSNGDSSITPSSNKFTKTATWKFEQNYSADNKTITQCFDFDHDQITDCSGTAWDIKIEQGSNGSATPKFYTNSGVSGEGDGAALGGPFDYSWERLQDFLDGNKDKNGEPVPTIAFMQDGIDNAFTDALFTYNHATHGVDANYNVFVVTTDTAQKLTEITDAGKAFVLQATNYYGGNGGAQSGFITLRWVDVTDASNIQEEKIDASSDTQWTHYAYDANGLTKVDAPNTNNWHIAFQRYNVKINSGISGDGTAGSFKGTAPTAETEEARTDALKNSVANWGWGARTSWTVDSASSSLNPAYQGVYPDAMNFGFYKYYPTDAAAKAVGLSQHMLGANSENGVMLRSGEGNTYARMHITKIEYGEPAVPADNKPYNADRTYTIEFEVTE